MKIMQLLAQWFFPDQNRSTSIPLVDGKYADEYRCPVIREQIAEAYRQAVTKTPNPLSNPELYDPLDPPQGWRYDPYYELWIQSND